MHEQPKSMAKTGGKACEPSGNGSAKRPLAGGTLVASGSQHGAGLEDSLEPSPVRGKRDGAATDLDDVCSPGDGDRQHTGQSRAAERMAPVGNASRQERRQVRSEGQANMVTPRGPVSTDNVLLLLESQRYRCALTGRDLTPETAALDHILPLRCSGEHVSENTQVLHRGVNRAKGSLTNVEFIGLCGEVVAHSTAGGAGGGCL